MLIQCRPIIRNSNLVMGCADLNYLTHFEMLARMDAFDDFFMPCLGRVGFIIMFV